MTTIDREFLRMLADEYAGPGNPSIPADTLRGLLDELDKAEARIKAVYELLDENPAAYATVYSNNIRRALDA